MQVAVLKLTRLLSNCQAQRRLHASTTHVYDAQVMQSVRWCSCHSRVREASAGSGPNAQAAVLSRCAAHMMAAQAVTSDVQGQEHATWGLKGENEEQGNAYFGYTRRCRLSVLSLQKCEGLPLPNALNVSLDRQSNVCMQACCWRRKGKTMSSGNSNEEKLEVCPSSSCMHAGLLLALARTCSRML